MAAIRPDVVILIRAFQNGPNDFHRISGSKYCVNLFSCSFLCLQTTAQISTIKNVTIVAFPLLWMFIENMSIFWCKNVSRITEKQSMCIYSEFYLSFSGYCKVFQNYIAALTITKKLLLASIFKWLWNKNEPFQDQNSYMKSYPHHPFCHITTSKSQK